MRIMRLTLKTKESKINRMSKCNLSRAKRLATQLWGTPVHQYKLTEGIWEFSTHNHSGIVVDIEAWPLLQEYQRKIIRYGRYAMDYEQHFAAFGEDDAAIVEWVYGKEFYDKRFFKRYKKGPEQSTEAFLVERLQSVRGRLQRWHPEVLERWPEPYVGNAQ